MPITYVDKVSRLANVQTVLEGAQSSITGSHVAPATRTGLLIAQAAPDIAAILGQNFSNANRTGVIQTTLGGATAVLLGTAGDPNIPTVAHGQSVTITGSGFGAAPVTSFLQPTIEATNVGSNIALSSPWLLLDAPIAINQGYNDATRGRCVRATYNAASQFNLGLAWDRGSNAPANEYLMFTWWVRAENLGPNFPPELNDNGGTTFPGGGNWQWKLCRFRLNNSVNDSFGSGDALVSHWDNEDGSYITLSGGTEFHYINGVGGSAPGSIQPPFVNNVSGRRAGGDDLPTSYTQAWYRCDWLWFMGAAGTGRVRMTVRREGSTRNHVGNLSGMTLTNRAWRYFEVQNYLGNNPGGTDFNGTRLAIDDVYVQRGSHLRRVELCSHASLSAADAAGGWREIQPASAWSDTAATVTLNRGANRQGTAYLHMVETNIETGNDTSLASRQITVAP